MEIARYDKMDGDRAGFLWGDRNYGMECLGHAFGWTMIRGSWVATDAL